MTGKLVLAADVAAEFPHTLIGFVLAGGLCNSEPWPVAAAELAAIEESVAGGGWRPYDGTRPEIASWHDAYRRFGTNPRRLRPSVDALGRRLARDHRLPRINPAVDAYNLVSVRSGLPVGAFDLAGVDGPIHVRFAGDGDVFVPLGEPDVVERPRAGEVVYATGERVLTRHWNHRDAHASRVTEVSRDVLFLVERVSDVVARDSVERTVDGLAGLVAAHAERVSTGWVGPDVPAATLSR